MHITRTTKLKKRMYAKQNFYEILNIKEKIFLFQLDKLVESIKLYV